MSRGQRRRKIWGGDAEEIMMDDVEENNRRIDWKDWSEKNKLKRSYRRGGKGEMWMVE